MVPVDSLARSSPCPSSWTPGCEASGWSLGLSMCPAGGGGGGLPSPGPWPVCGLLPRTPSTPHPPTHPARHPFQKHLQAADVCQWAQGSQGHPVSRVLNRTRKGLPLCASPPP